MSVIGLYRIYHNYKHHFFPHLLKEGDLGVSPEDKRLIEELLKNPSIRIRHSSLTEKSTILREPVLRAHAGWSGRSQMHLKHWHKIMKNLA
jgi:hypothetical protein